MISFSRTFRKTEIFQRTFYFIIFFIWSKFSSSLGVLEHFEGIGSYLNSKILSDSVYRNEPNIIKSKNEVQIKIIKWSNFAKYFHL